MSELVKRVDPSACWFSRAQCLEYIQAPYHPFSDIIRTLGIRAQDDAVIEASVKWLSSDMLNHFAQPAAEANRRKLRAFEGIVESLRMLARVRPLIVAVEDAHWADIGSTELLQFLIPRLGDSRIFLIVTYRDGGLSGNLLHANAARSF